MEGLKQQVRTDKRNGRFLFNHNTVEATLIFCACMVCLSGIMFESTKDDGEDPGRQALAVMVIILIFASLGYFLFVFITEIMDSTCPELVERFKKDTKKSLIELEHERKKKAEAMEQGSSFQYNPMVTVDRSEGTTAEETSA